MTDVVVIPAQAGIQAVSWIPAFAGMTDVVVIPAQAGIQVVSSGFPHSRE
jgi:hypothetical protein